MATAAADAAAAVPDARRWTKAGPSSPVTTAIFLFFFVVVVGVLVSARWITTTTHLAITNLDQWRTQPAILTGTYTTSIPAIPAGPPPPRPTYSLSCSAPPLARDPDIPSNISQTLSLALASNATCASLPDPQPIPAAAAANATCPAYFRFIHEDLHPWRAAGGITRAMLDRARATANFRLVVLRGRAYIERIAPAFQTRDLFTIWGILQLLRRYPGRVPDLDLMFDCVDWPVVHADEYQGDNATAMPPLFRYCGDNETLDVVFPDWSFWGWAEINIKPWDALQKDLSVGNKRVRWIDREPYAYWKGNPEVAAIRQELVKCNVSSKQEWNARIYKQDWIKESKAGYKKSNLANQCTHRYKIYIEGSAWSVSEKYILACDSMTLVIKPKYYDFFSRVLMPTQHYWPVRDDSKCSSIKYAVDWGNSHKKKAQQIGKKASKFIQQELSMDHIYDYMFHLLTEYAKLLRFKPTKPPEAVEVCPESLACQAIGREKKFMQDSMVKSANVAGPCNLPPPFSPEEYRKLQQRKEKYMDQVETLERNASKLEERNASKPEDSNPEEQNASKSEERNASKPEDSNPEERNASKPEDSNPEERNASKPEDSNPEERNASKPEDSHR
ncbi:protein O-glucosyltransferase 1-like [Hordeum vulgare]|uniref:Glycosyl transferase CAP10 domain-containing protein n=1 Tax=Hordeum vulgare subsp. vulgare TaxID=112509 RepID=A0A8I6YTL8_HORVV|nr:O-glucosyltransferase rumi homolog isoform X1 [Hordeum vulgare subsp. vulgare]KAE8807114.1 protein O-glucosyltransferase 1-like [Hordeum vulgare]